MLHTVRVLLVIAQPGFQLGNAQQASRRECSEWGPQLNELLMQLMLLLGRRNSATL